MRESKIVKHLRYGFCLTYKTNRITENVIIFPFAYDSYKKKRNIYLTKIFILRSYN